MQPISCLGLRVYRDRLIGYVPDFALGISDLGPMDVEGCLGDLAIKKRLASGVVTGQSWSKIQSPDCEIIAILDDHGVSNGPAA
jgi:hypothetical protein